MQTLKLKIEQPGVLLVSLFYAIVGIALFFILALASFRPPHVGVLAVLNLILAYGVFKMKKWSVKLLAILFLPQIVFGAITLYYSIIMWTLSLTLWATAVNLLLIFYIVLCFVSLIYVAAKKKNFK